ncbi:TonB-dependent receptor [Sphingomonas sp.]|uniref:TonB-dependent receptor n=1 Tax=Sphingomonas sp. TaxID=28214 RepID=UPI0025E53807|nr:TonB-dependent receptor [Sphingomonas sp.]
MTAQRKVETAQKAAVAISVVGGADIVRGGVANVTTLSSLVPALTIQQIGASNASFIRGVGNFSVSVTSDPAVAFNYDGVYLGRINSTSGTFYDLERIEVLKGPQGTLYGRNATAGVINILPTQPKLGETSGYATASYGNFNDLAIEGAANIALGENGAMRVSGAIHNRDGYNNDGTSDNKSDALRIQLKAQLTPQLMVRVSGDYTHLGGRGGSWSYLGRYTATTFTPSGLSRSEGVNSPASQAYFQALGAGAIGQVRARRDPFPQIFQNSDFFGTNAVVEYDTGAGVLTLEPAIRFDRIRNLNPAGGFPSNNDQRDLQYSMEARFAGKIGLFDYTLGGFYFNEDVSLRGDTTTFGSNASFNTTSQKTDSYAFFGRVTAHLTDKLRLVGGVRYTHDTKTLDASRIAISVNCSVPFTCINTILPPSVPYLSQLPFAVPAGNGQVVPGPVAGTTVSRSDTVFVRRSTFTHPTYRGAVEFDVGPRSLLYASVETGFRSGGFNTAVGFETFEPEFITAFTLGSKNRFFDNRLQINLEGFYWKYRNQQTAHPGFDRGRPPSANSITENIGKSTIKGFEVETRFLLTPTTVLGADVQYLDAVNDSFTYSTSAALQSRTGCPTAASVPATIPASIVVNCAGLPSFNSPKWTVNLSAQQTVPVGNYKLVLNADTQYKSSRFMGFEYQPEQLQSASWTSNAQITFSPENDRWSIGAYVRNIENKRLLAAPFAFGGVLVAYTTAPRTYGVRVAAKF